MDSLREQRFLIPPFFLIIVFLINYALSGKDYSPDMTNESNLKIFIGAITLMISTYAFGYIIGSITIFLINFLFRSTYYFKNWKQYEINEFKDFHKNAYLILYGEKDGNLIVNENLRVWIVRRWSIVEINIDSIVGILFGWLFSISFLSIKCEHWLCEHWLWILINLIIVVIFFRNASIARDDILNIEEVILKRHILNL